jgi:hypothetical protein
MSNGSFTEWSTKVRDLSARVEELRTRTASWQLPDLTTSEWYGELQHKLVPQTTGEPFLVVAVCGGTNTGKSVILNHLANATVSHSHPLATHTKHPVCCLPVGFRERHDLAAIFPGFELREWSSEQDAVGEGPDNLLFWRTDPGGQQPARLLLLDTPDVDGVLEANHRRAEMVRHVSDVLVAVLTGQKYNDAAIRNFFKAAAQADKTIIAVFNQVHWPSQAEVSRAWLAGFCKETGCSPVASYAAPWDDLAAKERTLTFHPLSPNAQHPRRDLAELQFDQIKLRTMSGSLKLVLDEQRGLPAQLRTWANQAIQYTEMYELLSRDMQVPVRNLPQLPRQMLWDEIWSWMNERRSTWERVLNQTFSAPYRLINRFLGKNEATAEQEFRKQEWDSFRVALEEFLERLGHLQKGGNAILSQTLANATPSVDRAALFAELERRYQALPLLTTDYQSYVRMQLQSFADAHPNYMSILNYGMMTAAVVRPLLTIGLGLYGASAIDIASNYALNLAGDVGIVAGTTVVGEGIVAAAQQLLTQLFNRYYAERGATLAKLLHELVLGNSVTELAQSAKLTDSTAWIAVQRLLVELRAGL